jgi:TolA-binding protein
MAIYKKTHQEAVMKSWLRKILAGLVIAQAFSAAPVAAEEKVASESRAQYLQQMQTKLDHTARRANQPNSEGSSVVGLRGSKQESSSKQLYWKGKTGKVAVSPEEVKAFRAAVEQAQAGKDVEATAALKAFQEKYPKSALAPDVQETLIKISASPQP